MPKKLIVQLLGEFTLSLDGVPCAAIDTIRLRTLFANLLLKRGTALQRSRLAFQYWPDSSEKQAQTNFRHLLHSLRKAFPDAETYIDANAKTIEWKEIEGLELDVEAFEETYAAARNACKRGDLTVASAQFEKAVNLYRGDLLPGHYDEWVEEMRESLRQSFGEALQSAVSCFESKRDYAEAIRFCQKLRQFEPTREKTYASLMRLYALSGDRAQALQTYRDCEAMLRKELDVSPSERTNELYRKLLAEEPLEVAKKPAASAAFEPELPLQGRAAEWSQLQAAWANAATGQSQLIVLIGEAGIGKSRLAEELFVTLARQGVATCRTRSYAAEGRLAYAPVCQWMRSPVLKPVLETLEPVWLAEIARIMPELRGEYPDLPDASGDQGSNWQRHLLFEALSRAVLAKEEPVMLLLDDMQWTDQETLEWLRFLLRFGQTSKLLITGTIREEELTQDHPLRRTLLELSRDGQMSEIQLGPISPEDAALVAAGVAGHDLSSREAAQLYETTEGNPLFVVESVRAGLRSRSESSLDSYEGLDFSATLPRKVHAVFTTRLAQLTPQALELSRIAAVFGRAFTIEMLIDVSGKSEEETIELLDELWEKRILREEEAGRYDFTHDKLREVTYEQISTPKRRLLHRKSSQVLEVFFADDLDAVMSQLASHYEMAGQVTKAIDAYFKAGLSAKELNATPEAIRLLEKAMGLLVQQPKVPANLEKELDLCTALVVCMVAEFGYQTPTVQLLYERSQELCSLLNRPTSAPVLRGLALYNLVFGNLHETVRLAGNLAEYYEDSKDEVLYVESEYVLGVATFWLGRFVESRDHLERSMARYDPKLSRIHIAQYAQDPKAICLCRMGWTQVMLGNLDSGARYVAESIDYASTTEHPHTEGYVLSFGGQVCWDLGDYDLMKSYVERFKILSLEHQLTFWETRCEMMDGFYQVVTQGDLSGLERIRENFELCIERKHTISLSSILVLFVNAYQHIGESEKGLQIMDTYEPALANIDETFYDAELHRVRGELLLECGRSRNQVSGFFAKALDIAQQQDSLLQELRARLSLAKLWKGSKQAAETREALEGVFGRFTEGFQRPDLKAVRQFLGK